MAMTPDGFAASQAVNSSVASVTSKSATAAAAIESAIVEYDPEQTRILIQAVKNDNLATARQALSNGADPNTQESFLKNVPLLNLAARQHSQGMVQLLLQNGANVKDFNWRDFLPLAGTRQEGIFPSPNFELLNSALAIAKMIISAATYLNVENSYRNSLAGAVMGYYDSRSMQLPQEFKIRKQEVWERIVDLIITKGADLLVTAKQIQLLLLALTECIPRTHLQSHLHSGVAIRLNFPGSLTAGVAYSKKYREIRPLLQYVDQIAAAPLALIEEKCASVRHFAGFPTEVISGALAGYLAESLWQRDQFLLRYQEILAKEGAPTGEAAPAAAAGVFTLVEAVAVMPERFAEFEERLRSSQRLKKSAAQVHVRKSSPQFVSAASVAARVAASAQDISPLPLQLAARQQRILPSQEVDGSSKEIAAQQQRLINEQCARIHEYCRFQDAAVTEALAGYVAESQGQRNQFLLCYNSMIARESVPPPEHGAEISSAIPARRSSPPRSPARF